MLQDIFTTPGWHRVLTGTLQCPICANQNSNRAADRQLMQLCSSCVAVVRKWVLQLEFRESELLISLETSFTVFFLSWRLQLDDVRKKLRVLPRTKCVMLHEKDEHMFLVLILMFWCFPCLGLNKHVSSLWTCVSGLNDTVIRHRGLLDFIQNGQDDIHSRVKNLNSSLNQVSRDLQGLSEQDLTGELLLPLILFGGFSATVWFLSTAPLWSE